MEGKLQFHSHLMLMEVLKGSGSLLNSFLSRLMKETIQWCLGHSSFFFFHLVPDDTGALDCVLNGCCNVLCTTEGFCASKANSISKKIPSPFPALWLSLVLQLLLSLASLCSFLWTSNFWCLLAVPAASPLFYTCFWTSWCWNKDTVLYVVLYSKVHKSTTACRGCTRMTVYTRHMS